MPEEKGIFPSGLQAALLIVALFLCEVVVGSALGDARRMAGLTRGQVEALTVLLANGCVFAVVMHFQKLTYRHLFHQNSASVKATLALMVPSVLLLVPALTLSISALLQILVRVAPYSNWEEQFFERMAYGGIAATTAVCMLAPVLEEMLFRGIILRGFLTRYQRWQAIWASAALFGATHMNMYQFVGGLVMGLLLGWLYERTHSLIPCIALHAAYNSAWMVLSNLGSNPPGDWMSDGSSWIWGLAAAAAVCGSWMLRLLLVARPAR